MSLTTVLTVCLDSLALFVSIKPKCGTLFLSLTSPNPGSLPLVYQIVLLLASLISAFYLGYFSLFFFLSLIQIYLANFLFKLLFIGVCLLYGVEFHKENLWFLTVTRCPLDSLSNSWALLPI